MLYAMYLLCPINATIGGVVAAVPDLVVQCLGRDNITAGQLELSRQAFG